VGGADPGGPRVDHELRVFGGLDAPGRVDPHALGKKVAEQLYVLGRGATGCFAGGGLDEVGPRVFHDLADQTFQLLVEVVGLHVGLHQYETPAGVDARHPDRAHHAAQFVAHVAEVAGQHGRDVHHHVDLVGAQRHGLLRAHDLGALRVGPQGEGHDRPHFDVIALEQLAGHRHAVGEDADRGEVVRDRVAA